jgi:purine-binding chemotaxis protein CheW
MNESSTGAPSLAGKYLCFRLGGEEYGVGILRVREILALQPITPLPRMPEHVRGVINLRGRILPVVDLRTMLGLAQTPASATTCIVVIDAPQRSSNTRIGFLVDAVREVLALEAARIEHPPVLGDGVPTGVLLGLAKVGEPPRVLALLDVDALLEMTELRVDASSPT